ncbi:MAG TPA: DpnD/PcfM family protein [Bacillota bacterium]|nr:DpnD/PcfM family protein [Bacillota bacterium]
MKYRVEVTETLQRIIEIDAESNEEAESKARRQYRNEDIVLDSADFIDVEFEVLSEQESVFKK